MFRNNILEIIILIVKKVIVCNPRKIIILVCKVTVFKIEIKLNNKKFYLKIWTNNQLNKINFKIIIISKMMEIVNLLNKNKILKKNY